jgi:dipeptidyl aminopeptidase/acylaminoacyl peptidase
VPGPRQQQQPVRPARNQQRQWLAEQGFTVLVTDGRGTPTPSARTARRAASP